MLTLAHAVVDEVRRRALVRLDVRGTPIVEMWHASTLGLGRALPAALALQRFATTPEATQAISTGRAGAVSSRRARRSTSRSGSRSPPVTAVVGPREPRQRQRQRPEQQAEVAQRDVAVALRRR